MTNLPFPPGYTIPDLVKITHLSRYLIQREIDEGRLVPIPVPGPIRFSQDEVLRWWADQPAKAPPIPQG
jgi:hypothetical protein